MGSDGGAALWVSVTVAVISGLAALAAAAYSNRAQRRNASAIETLRRELDDESRQRALVRRYQEPLVRAGYDLQSRLWNILRGGFLEANFGNPKGRGWSYAQDSTVWLFAQYFGWVEIVRREVQFIPSTRDDQSRRLESVLAEVAHVCSTDTEMPDDIFMIHRAEQRALGELVIIEGHDAEGRTRATCMGFAAFQAALDDPASAIARWFAPVRDDVSACAAGGGRERLRRLQHALMDLVDVIDPGPEHVRFPGPRERVGVRARTE